jgi:hypothetical protein
MSRRTGRSGILEADDCVPPAVVCAFKGAAARARIAIREMALRNRTVIEAPEIVQPLVASGLGETIQPKEK